MDLSKYAGERVRLLTVDDLTYVGIVGDYIDPEDDYEGKEMIIVDDEIRNTPVGFYPEDILSISII